MSVIPIDEYRLIARRPQRPVSERKLEANRRNARKSKGPTSARGRAISSQNARKYKFLPLENPALPAQLTAKYYGYFIPANRSERSLVDALVYADRLRRHYLHQESRAIAQEIRDIEISSIPELMARASRRFSSIPFRLAVAESKARNAYQELESLRSKAA